MTGNSEIIARTLARELVRAGMSTAIRDMADCEPDVLTRAEYVFIVTSTYGEGEPPETAVCFWKAVARDLELDLRRVKYSVLALGNSTFDHFCQCGRDLDAALERHGGIRIAPRVDCDVDYEAPAKEWLDRVLSALGENRC
jgi:sulfite reductase (NADPH) flavoprotein alpha-component